MSRNTFGHRVVRHGTLFLALLGVSLVALLGPVSSAQAADTTGGIILISAPLGSGHAYSGTYNPCTGAFAATGTASGYTGTHQEIVTGTFLNGTLTYTSVYQGDVSDGASTYYNPYTYSLSVPVVANTFAGSYTVVKTALGSTTTVTEGPFEFSGGWVDAKTDAGVTCAAPDPLTNHGQYVSGAAKAGIKGPALAKIANDKTLVGPYPG